MRSNPSALEVRTMKQVALRIVPFLMVCYFVSFVDRVNLGFAALQMVNDLHRLRRRYFLRVVLPLRGAEQLAPREVRRSPLARSHHDHVGSAGGRYGVGQGAAVTLSDAASARGC